MAALVAMAIVGTMPGLLTTVSAVDDGTPPARPVDLVWANGQLWDSVVLGTLHGNVPMQTLDEFYMIPGQNPVAESAPGDADYSAGRWLPVMLQWVGSGSAPLFTDGEQVEAAMTAGDLVVVAMGTPFLCPLTNPNNGA
jgi:hypothetical protein